MEKLAGLGTAALIFILKLTKNFGSKIPENSEEVEGNQYLQEKKDGHMEVSEEVRSNRI